MAKLSCTLLVDDDETTNFLNRLLFQRLAVTETLLVALNGQQALDLLAANCQSAASPTCPALILLDMKMPVMNGFEFLEAYARLPLAQREAVVIIMLTTSLNPQDVERMQGLPIAGFLTKPLTREKISHLLQTQFNEPLANG